MVKSKGYKLKLRWRNQIRVGKPSTHLICRCRQTERPDWRGSWPAQGWCLHYEQLLHGREDITRVSLLSYLNEDLQRMYRLSASRILCSASWDILSEVAGSMGRVTEDRRKPLTPFLTWECTELRCNVQLNDISNARAVLTVLEGIRGGGTGNETSRSGSDVSAIRKGVVLSVPHLAEKVESNLF